MKIGVNSRIYQQKETGIPYYIKSLYEKLLQIDKSNNYVFLQTDTNKKIGETKTLAVSRGNLGAFLFDNLLVNRLIGQEKVNIFHGPAHILPIIKQKDVKYVVTIHDLSFLRFPKDSSALFYLYYKNAVGQSLKNADIIVADSNSTKSDIIEFYAITAEKIRVVYLGVNEIYLQQSKKECLIAEPYFFSLTTHPRRKNILSVLEVLARNQRLSNLKYVIAGLIEEDQLKELQAKISELGLVDKAILFGYASEQQLISLYQNAEFFIYPSFYEGFGLPVLEAMACGCPVITSNVSSLPEIVPDQHWLVDPYSLTDISNKIDQLLSLSKTEREKLIQKNFELAQNFTWEKTAKKMLEIFEEFTT